MQLNQYKLQSEIGKVRYWSLCLSQATCTHTHKYGWKLAKIPCNLFVLGFLFVFFALFEQGLFKVKV